MLVPLRYLKILDNLALEVSLEVREKGGQQGDFNRTWPLEIKMESILFCDPVITEY